MDVLTIFLISIGLAMDAFAVSIAKGIVTKEQRIKSALLLSVFFGGFQMLMPVVGYLAGVSFESAISGIDHWIAFGLLSFIGLKMIYDSTRKKTAKKEEKLELHSLLVLSLATSIDALMVGLSFAFLQTSILEPVLTIGLVTFILSYVGFFLGCGVERIFGNKVKIVGGLILIAIGIRILLEHLS
ncbi:MAG TPA: manganese efflux pump MntP family protein [Candidatus Bathyarchaeia archaeon]